MLQSLRNRRNRKGFTLAELLIVVAIIAVLVAIAVPLFVGQLQNAEQATKDANMRAVRSTAVSTILLNEKKDAETSPFDYMHVGGISSGEEAKAWKVEANVGMNGDILTLSIVPQATKGADKEDCKKVKADSDGETEEAKVDHYQVTVWVTDLTSKITNK